MSATLARPNAALSDRYSADSGTALMSGIQALVRMLLDQRALDVARGLDTGIFVSGYQGSPLGGLDQELARAAPLLDPAGIVFKPGVNEELAATAVAGTQLLGELPGATRDGVTGFWYGKSPGLDRAADAIRHGNLSGTSPRGGAVALIGDDPASKSSTVPSSCEPMCRSLVVPLLAPGTVQELLAAGLHAVAMSRHAGLWTGLKIVADIADASATVQVGAGLAGVPDLPARGGFEPPVLLPPTNLVAEGDLMSGRLERAREYGARAGLNRVSVEPRRPAIAIVAAGVAHQAVLRALEDLGLGQDACDALGLRVVGIGMPWPLDRDEIRRLTAGVHTVLVAEDKLPFLETQIRDALYRTPDAPLVLGAQDAEGRPLFEPQATMTADRVARAIGRVVDHAALPASARARADVLEAAAQRPSAGAPLARRTPYFCSGCPHNVSTRANPEDLVGVGIGCHTMVALDHGDRRGKLIGMPQMGGEGAQWIGLAPFTDDAHFIQNLGDGTFHHSGSLAIRAAVAAGVNITYRLLYNDTVAMTGGQQPQGKLDVPSITRLLEVEGVKRVVITTPEPDRYRGVALAAIASVEHRDAIADVQAGLAATAGVTVIIHDDQCATEKRRLRKRGKLAEATQRVWINERVCEGCGDCGEQSTCLSVQPVATEFGRKTEIHQASCNSDMTCLKGDCPSFVMVTTPAADATAANVVPDLPVALVDPPRRVPDDVLIRMPGIGGTGVVTVSAVLQMAAHLDGRHAAGLEQTGLAQKGGPVVSDIRIASEPVVGQIRAGAGAADLLLGLDLLGAAAPETLLTAAPDRTVAVLNTAQTPTAQMVTEVTAVAADTDAALSAIDGVTRVAERVTVDALGLSERLFDDHMPTNMLMAGAAFQQGCLPLSAAAIERAIELNGAAVDVNVAAFRWGRAWVLDPEGVTAALASVPAPEAAPDRATAELLARAGVRGELERLLGIRVPELRAYQDDAYARRYLDDVLDVAALEQERTEHSSTAVSEAYACGLFKLMAYKDEYEVARLHLEAAELTRRAEAFGAGVKARILLQPPLLRSLGLKRKIAVGPWAFGGLHHARRLRGTPLDPFGRARVRRLERELVGEYRDLVCHALEHLSVATAAQVAAIADLPDVIRGYEDVKLRNVERFRAQASAMLATLEATEIRAHARKLPMLQHVGR